eukprot:13136402-Alexandrium_andersonii.AAC.1
MFSRSSGRAELPRKHQKRPPSACPRLFRALSVSRRHRSLVQRTSNSPEQLLKWPESARGRRSVLSW